MSHNNNNVNNAYANLGGSSSGDSNGSRSEQYEEFQRKQKELREEREAFHERLENKAMAAAVEACVLAGAVATGLTVLATKRFHGFNRFMSLSAKAALPVSAAMFAYCYQYEVSTIKYIRNPVKYGLIEGEVYEDVLKEVNVPPLAVHYRFVNWLYDNPFKMIAACGSTVLLAVLNQQFKLRHLTFSQRIMCSRIFAQAGLVGITITVLSFREYMDRRGRFQPERLDIKESI